MRTGWNLFHAIQGSALAALLIGGLVAGGTAQASLGRSRAPATPPREPLPFTDAYRDGYVLLLWGERRGEAEVATLIRRVAASGSRHLTIPFFGCQSDLKSSDVGSCDLSTRPYVAMMAEVARREGLEVSFLPILVTKKGEWRGQFDPSDVDAWFGAYQRWILALAEDSARLGARELVVATEMTKLYKHEQRWREIARAVRRFFAGPLVMTANWDDLSHSFWDEADAIGVSAYFPLSRRSNPSQDELDKAWREHRDKLLKLSARWERPIHVTEVGYPSATHAAEKPWLTPPDAVADPSLQARCFEAFRRAWEGERSLVRANVWGAGDPAESYAPLGFDPIGKAAGLVLERFFASRGMD